MFSIAKADSRSRLQHGRTQVVLNPFHVSEKGPLTGTVGYWQSQIDFESNVQNGLHVVSAHDL